MFSHADCRAALPGYQPGTRSSGWYLCRPWPCPVKLSHLILGCICTHLQAVEHVLAWEEEKKARGNHLPGRQIIYDVGQISSSYRPTAAGYMRPITELVDYALSGYYRSLLCNCLPLQPPNMPTTYAKPILAGARGSQQTENAGGRGRGRRFDTNSRRGHAL